MVECIKIGQDNGHLILKLSLPFVLFLFLFGCIILPFLLKDLRGHSKLYMIFHQISIVFYVTLIFVTHIVKDSLRNTTITEQSFRILIARKLSLIIPCSSIIKQFFYYQYHAFTFLQCAHYRSMICDPLRFKEYKAFKKVLRRIAIALVLSSLLLLDDITQITFIYKQKSTLEDVGQADSLVGATTFYSLAELSVSKLVYIGALAKMGFDIKKSLSEAGNVRDDQTTRKPLFYIVAVIPLINAIFCSITDITTAAISVYLRSNLEKYECSRADEEFPHVVQIPLVASVYLLTSVINTFGYLICFPKLCFCCQKT